MILSLISVILLSIPVFSQESEEKEDVPRFNTEAYIELLKMDVKAKKMMLISEGLQLTQDEADKFWPVYKEYEDEVGGMFEKSLEVLQKYAKHYENMDEETVKELLNASLKLDQKEIKLRTKYTEKMLDILPAKKAAKFYQLDNRINMLINLQIASEVPVLN